MGLFLNCSCIISMVMITINGLVFILFYLLGGIIEDFCLNNIGYLVNVVIEM